MNKFETTGRNSIKRDNFVSSKGVEENTALFRWHLFMLIECYILRHCFESSYLSVKSDRPFATILLRASFNTG